MAEKAGLPRTFYGGDPATRPYLNATAECVTCPSQLCDGTATIRPQARGLARRRTQAYRWRSMFERFTEDARDVVRLAADEARELSHARIGTEHLLLAFGRK